MHITSKLLLLLIILATNNGNAIMCPNPDPNNNDDGIDSILRPLLMIGYPYTVCTVFNNNDDKGDNLPRDVTGAEFDGIQLVNALGAQVAHLTLKPFVLGGIFRFINSTIFNVEFSAVHAPGIAASISFEGTTFMCTGIGNTRFFDRSTFKGDFNRVTINNQKNLGGLCIFAENSTMLGSTFDSANFLGNGTPLEITSVNLSGSTFDKTNFNFVRINSFNDCNLLLPNGNDCTSRLDGTTFTGSPENDHVDAIMEIWRTSLTNATFNNFLGSIQFFGSDLSAVTLTPKGEDNRWTINDSKIDGMQILGNNSKMGLLTIANSFTNNRQNGDGPKQFSVTKTMLNQFNIFQGSKLNLDFKYNHIKDIMVNGNQIRLGMHVLYNFIDNFSILSNQAPQHNIGSIIFNHYIDNSIFECSIMDNIDWAQTSYRNIKLLTSIIKQQRIDSSYGNFILDKSEICPDPEDDGRNLVAALREAVDEGMPEDLPEQYQQALRGGIAAIDLNIGQPQQQGEGSGINVRANRAMVNPTLYGTVITIDTGKTLTIDHGNLHGVTINGLGTLILIGTTFDANSNVNVGTLIATHIINQTALTVLHATILYLSYILTKS